MRRLAVALALIVGALGHWAGAAQGADAYQPSRCAWMAPYLAQHGLPVATFQRISWRESGCAFRAPCVSTRTDLACSRFGLNFRGSMPRYWARLCGVSSHLQTRYFHLDLKCTAAAYRAMGLRPWQ